MCSLVETKRCGRCKEEKPLSEFGNHSRSKDGLRHVCKKCNCDQVKEYMKRNPEKIKAKTKRYYESNKDVLKEKVRIYREENKDMLRECRRKYNLEHKEERKLYYESNKDYYKQYREEHKNEIKERTARWREENREIVLKKARQRYYDNIEYYRKYQQRMKEVFKAKRLLKKEHYHQYYLDNKDKITQRSYDYQKTPKGKVMRTRIRQRRRNLGYSPINKWFEGAHYHHLRYDGNGNQNNDIGLFIPSELHYSVGHDGQTGRGMDEINKLAVTWYLENKGEITEEIQYYIDYYKLNFIVNYKEVLGL